MTIKRLSIICMLLLLCIPVFSATEPMDIIVLVDTSISMESCFNDVIAFLVDDLLATKVNYNDTLHLLQFSDYSIHESTQKLTNDYSLSTIVREILFLRAKVILGKYTDVINAVESLGVYISSLPLSRDKKIYLITDMVHDPPPSSPYADRDPEFIKFVLSRSTDILRQKDGWYVLAASLPGNTSVRTTFFKTTIGTQPQLRHTFSETTIGTQPQLRHTFSETTIGTQPQLRTTSDNTTDILSENTDTFPYARSRDHATSHSFLSLIQALGIGNENFTPEQSQLYSLFMERHQADESMPFSEQDTYTIFGSFSGKSGIVIILLLFLSLVIFLMVFLCVLIITRKKKLEENFDNPFTTEKWQDHIASLFGDDIPLIEMRVSFQNHHIGFRNIHKIKEHKIMSVGGGMSRFLIFLIPMPQRIAEISYENGKYIFSPVLMEYFPDLKGPVIDCLNKEIPVVSNHGYRSLIIFRKYVSPLIQLHSLLHSINYKEENSKEVLHTHKLALSALVS